MTPRVLRRSTWPLLAPLLACAPFAVWACSLVVSGDPPIKCVSGTPDPCGEGARCVDGRCQRGAPAPPPPPPTDAGMDAEPADDTGPTIAELCNCVDDDGDGLVDEDFDSDRDRSTLCGCFGVGIDCDDTDPGVHPPVILPPDEFGNDAGMIPAATERCDGKNNDCDGETDEMTCPAMQLCRQNRCIAENDCTITGCPSDQRCEGGVCVTGRCSDDDDCTTPPETSCDTMSGRCVAPRALGEPCDVDGECGASGTCVPRAALGLAGGNKVCTQPCCSDFDCGPVDGDQICYHAPSGVRTCANATLLAGLPVPGRLEAGQPCSSPSDCRSSMCSSEGGGCIAPCVERCPSLMVCNFGASLPSIGDAPARGGMYCDVDLASLGDNFDPCSDDLDCNSLFCHVGRCRNACANAADCFADNGYCASIVAVSDDVRPIAGDQARIQVCQEYPSTISDPGALDTRGVACMNNEDCQSQICIDGRCTDFCCTSAECGGGRCGPKRFGDGWVVVCSSP